MLLMGRKLEYNIKLTLKITNMCSMFYSLQTSVVAKGFLYSLQTSVGAEDLMILGPH
jgi:hypothetical protein